MAAFVPVFLIGITLVGFESPSGKAGGTAVLSHVQFELIARRIPLKALALVVCGLSILAYATTPLADSPSLTDDGTHGSSSLQSAKTRQYIVSSLIVNRRDIFGADTDAAGVTRRVYQLIDALHVTTPVSYTHLTLPTTPYV